MAKRIRNSKNLKVNKKKIFLLEGPSEKNLMKRSFEINFNNKNVIAKIKQQIYLDFKSDSINNMVKIIRNAANKVIPSNLNNSKKIFVWIDLDTYINENKIKNKNNFIENCNKINAKYKDEIHIVLNFSSLEHSFEILKQYEKPYEDEPTITKNTKINLDYTNFDFENIYLHCK